jgi:prepilin-type N-terminal cleavage/methylation domain-containing protein
VRDLKDRRSHRRGMTVIEVMFAIVILSGVMLAMSQFGQAFTRATRDAANLAVASDLATARLQLTRTHPTYTTIVSTFNGTSETSAGASNPSMAGFAGYTRTTAATRLQNDSTDYVTVTVTVNAAVLKRPVAKTAVIAAFR